MAAAEQAATDTHYCRPLAQNPVVHPVESLVLLGCHQEDQRVLCLPSDDTFASLPAAIAPRLLFPSSLAPLRMKVSKSMPTIVHKFSDAFFPSLSISPHFSLCPHLPFCRRRLVTSGVSSSPLLLDLNVNGCLKVIAFVAFGHKRPSPRNNLLCSSFALALLCDAEFA